MNETTVSEAVNQSNEDSGVLVADCSPKQPEPEVKPARKWTTQAGPIQSKKVQKAIQDISWEGRTYTELTGVIGGEEHRMSFTQVFGGQREDSIKALETVALKFEYTVTRENYQAIIEECARQVEVLRANRPVNDKRETPEQRAETIRKNQEAAAKREQQRQEQEAARRSQEEALRETASVPVSDAGGTTVRYNREHDGVEISFPSKPDRSVIDSCKRHGFRWAMRNKVWYNKFSADAWKTACRIAGVDELPAPASVNCNPDRSYVQAHEDAYHDAECARIGA